MVPGERTRRVLALARVLVWEFWLPPGLQLGPVAPC